MKIGISIKLDVTKIDKERLFKGEKGTYLDLTTFIDTEQTSQYGDHGVISQSQTKEERQQGVQMPILGNCKVFYKAASTEPREPQPQQTTPQPQSVLPNHDPDESIDGIPF